MLWTIQAIQYLDRVRNINIFLWCIIDIVVSVGQSHKFTSRKPSSYLPLYSNRESRINSPEVDLILCSDWRGKKVVPRFQNRGEFFVPLRSIFFVYFTWLTDSRNIISFLLKNNLVHIENIEVGCWHRTPMLSQIASIFCFDYAPFHLAN